MIDQQTDLNSALDRATAGQLRDALGRKLRAATSFSDDDPPFSTSDEVVDLADLEEAAVRWRRGECAETLHWLERALGIDFRGLGELRMEGGK